MRPDSASLIACIPRLRRYARALLGERAGADDLVQDTMERGWDRLASWRGGDPRPWLFSIMHNLHVDRLRQPGLATVALEADSLTAEQELALSTAAPEPHALRDLDTALALLPESQRAVLLLVALEDLSYEEVAQTLAIPLGTVMSRLSRGREQLRRLMADQQQPTTLKVVK